jgi:hypothetical protein
VKDDKPMTEIIFLVEEDPDGGLTACPVGDSIYTQADDITLLRAAVRDAVLCHFTENERPKIIRLHRVHDEVMVL